MAGTWLLTGYPDIFPQKVELELHVDGGGGEAGDEVVRMANNWIWKHGEKVQS